MNPAFPIAYRLASNLARLTDRPHFVYRAGRTVDVCDERPDGTCLVEVGSQGVVWASAEGKREIAGMGGSDE
jgi:hypothetical protein